MEKINLGVSACLLGQRVRFDGGHKQLKLVTETWQHFFNYVPECPEMGIGMPSPRPTIRLVGDETNQRLVDGRDISIDHTDKMVAFAHKKCDSMAHLSGFIVTAKSPSCGLERLKVYNEQGQTDNRKGVGVFTKVLLARWPNLPVEEDGRLNDVQLRENFLTRVYIYHNWQQLAASGLTLKKIVQFHSELKLLLMAHAPVAYKELGQLVANVKQYSLEQFADIYLAELMKGLKHIATRQKHTNVLQHIQGYFKKQLSKEQKAELSDVILRYNAGYLPLHAPLTLLKHYVKQHPNPYLVQQRYFEPYPLPLGYQG